MTVKELVDALALEILALPDPDREILGAYAGDLLSWVMGRAEEGNAWATIMTNQNVLAVATLINTSCVIVCENSEVDHDVIRLAQIKDVNLLRTSRPIYETCVSLSKLGL